MTNGAEPTDQSDPFHARRTYPEPAPLFTFQPSDIEKVKGSCLVVLDTNALLVP